MDLNNNNVEINSIINSAINLLTNWNHISSFVGAKHIDNISATLTTCMQQVFQSSSLTKENVSPLIETLLNISAEKNKESAAAALAKIEFETYQQQRSELLKRNTSLYAVVPPVVQPVPHPVVQQMPPVVQPVPPPVVQPVPPVVQEVTLDLPPDVQPVVLETLVDLALESSDLPLLDHVMDEFPLHDFTLAYNTVYLDSDQTHQMLLQEKQETTAMPTAMENTVTTFSLPTSTTPTIITTIHDTTESNQLMHRNVEAQSLPTKPTKKRKFLVSPSSSSSSSSSYFSSSFLPDVVTNTYGITDNDNDNDDNDNDDNDDDENNDHDQDVTCGENNDDQEDANPNINTKKTKTKKRLSFLEFYPSIQKIRYKPKKECHICFQRHFRFEILECKHEFCNKCITSHFRTQRQEKLPYNNCPTCRTVVPRLLTRREQKAMVIEEPPLTQADLQFLQRMNEYMNMDN